MKITPFIRSKRILEHIKSYELVLEQDKKKYLTNCSLQEDEQVLGIYKNDPKNDRDNVFFTNKGIHFYSEDKKIVIEYDKIKDIKVLGEKTIADTLLVGYKNNNGEQQARLSIRGGVGKGRDVFGVLHYLRRVSSDLTK